MKMNKQRFSPSTLLATIALAITCMIVGCGGGGSSATSSASAASSTPSPTPGAGSATTPTSSPTVASAPTKQPIASNAANTVPLTVGPGATGVVNVPTVSVRVCVPGTSTCQTVDNILVDTGSSGLRIIASALGAGASSLPQEQLTGGAPLAACAQFSDGYSYGSMVTADVAIGSETATSVPIQLIGDARTPTVPASCSSAGTSMNTVATFHSNGVLGIGTSPFDCGAACVTHVIDGTYYNCANANSCTATAAPLALQAANPVTHFPIDNNGVIVQLPPIAQGGQAMATGTLVFGIGTASNNALDSDATMVPTTLFGGFTAAIGTHTAQTAYIDSGTNVLLFVDPALTLCTSPFVGFYCPASIATEAVTLTGTNSQSSTSSFAVADTETLNSALYAFNDLGAEGATLTILGLPFFYGRHIAVAISGAATPSGPGPFVAY